MHRGAVAVIVIVAGGLNACGSGTEESNSASTTITISSAESTSSPSTEVERTTLVPDNTAGSPSTSSDAPTTTEAASIEDEVRTAAIRNYENYWDCLRRPELCDIGATTLAGSDAFNAFTATVEDLKAGGLFVGDEDVGYLTITSIEPLDDHTLVTSCWWSTGVLYVKPAIDGAQPVVQNNTPGTIRQADEFVQDPSDGEWKLRRSDVIEQIAEVNERPPES